MSSASVWVAVRILTNGTLTNVAVANSTENTTNVTSNTTNITANPQVSLSVSKSVNVSSAR